MQNIEITEGDFTAADGRYAIVAARFNRFIVQSLIEGAVNTLQRHGINDDNIRIYQVPGAYEIPLVVNKLAKSGNYDAIIALGAVIRGSTPHFDIVAGESARGCSSAMIEHGVPVSNGILATDSIEQAVERAGTKAGNKGTEAAVSAVEMVSLLKKLY